MKYIKLIINIADDYQESLIAELFDMDFDGFQQQDRQITAYITKEHFGIGDRERIEQLLAAYPDDGFIESEEVVAGRNWNFQWEQTIRPQTIGRFFVKPTWSQDRVPEGQILLEIDPKMSFGTGYHETTRLMLRFLPDVINKESRVLDAGTGTGILAIASVKLGAGQVLAFDIDEWSIINTKENILLNRVSEKITVKEGSAESIPAESMYDVVLANIQRNPILEMLPTFTEVLKKDGHLILSGLLEKDSSAISYQAKKRGLTIQETRSQNEWIAILLKKA